MSKLENFVFFNEKKTPWTYEVYVYEKNRDNRVINEKKNEYRSFV